MMDKGCLKPFTRYRTLKSWDGCNNREFPPYPVGYEFTTDAEGFIPGLNHAFRLFGDFGTFEEITEENNMTDIIVDGTKGERLKPNTRYECVYSENRRYYPVGYTFKTNDKGEFIARNSIIDVMGGGLGKFRELPAENPDSDLVQKIKVLESKVAELTKENAELKANVTRPADDLSRALYDLSWVEGHLKDIRKYVERTKDKLNGS